MSTDLGMPSLRPPVAPPGVGGLSGDRSFPAAAKDALADDQLRRNLGNATRTIRTKRAAVVDEVPDWAQLRAAGAAIKDDVLAHLDTYLIQLEEQPAPSADLPSLKAIGHAQAFRSSFRCHEAAGSIRGTSSRHPTSFIVDNKAERVSDA